MQCTRFVYIMSTLLFSPHIGALQRYFTPLRILFPKYISTITKHTQQKPCMWFPTHSTTLSPLKELRFRTTEQQQTPSLPHVSYALHDAADTGDHEQVRTLICSAREVRKTIDIPNAAGWTPLMLAIAKKRYGPLTLLLDAGADLYNKRNIQLSAFDIAQRHPKVIIFLKERGYLKPLAGSIFGEIWALSQEGLDMRVQIALVKSSLEDQFLAAAEVGNLPDLKAFWEKQDAETQKFLITTSNDAGETAFLRAVLRGYLDTAQFLLDQGADKYARTYAGESAMDLAIMCNDEPMMKLLVQKLQ
jgi:ankyrin repeat protein